MADPAPASLQLAEAEYFALLENSQHRLEYWNGQVVELSGGTVWHARIVSRTRAALTAQLAPGACELFGSELAIAVRLERSVNYLFPDASVICGAPSLQRQRGIDCAMNPFLIVEVLSESTEAQDRGRKLHAYTKIESLREYLLVDSQRPRLEIYSRGGSSETWRYRAFEGVDATLPIESLSILLPLGPLFQGLET